MGRGLLSKVLLIATKSLGITPTLYTLNFRLEMKQKHRLCSMQALILFIVSTFAYNEHSIKALECTMQDTMTSFHEMNRTSFDYKMASYFIRRVG